MIARHPGNCSTHEFQDATYGKGVRVMNPVYEKGQLIGARCTVCNPPKESGKKRGGVYAITDLVVVRQ